MAMGAGRAAFGVAMLLAPRMVGRSWVGEAADGPGGKTLVRAVAVRDLALGAGMLVALQRERPVRGWIEAGVVADLGDTAATLLAFGQLPPLGRMVTLLLAGGSAVAGAWAVSALDAQREESADGA